MRALVRIAFLLIALLAVGPVPSATSPPEYVQAVEFPYYLYPRALWERELVWLKTIGIRTVAFSIPWNWHQLQPGDYDFTGRTSARRDLVGFIRTLRRLNLRAWVRPLPPVTAWPGKGTPANGNDARAQREWLRQLANILAPQTVSHGGPVAYVEGRGLNIDAQPSPAPVNLVSAVDPAAFAKSREAIVAGAPRGSSAPLQATLWTDVEDALYPAGWAPGADSFLRSGAVGMAGDERPMAIALRRNAALLRLWGPRLAAMEAVSLLKTAGKLPEGVAVAELTSPAASVICVTNRSAQPFHDDLRVIDPSSRRTLVIPAAGVPAGESLWLPLRVSIGPGGPCRECANFSADEHIVYATAELLSVEYENGILAMEFAAPEAAEVILQLARQPVGPYLAGGKLSQFDWDDKALRARLPIPANPAPGSRVRIGIAIEEPDTSAFFNDLRRLIIGQKNTVSTTYSSAQVASRSRLLLPEGFTATRNAKSPNEIEYEVAVPSDAAHGDWVNLALEADGMLLGRSRVQLFRPASIHLTRAMQIHFGGQTELTPDPPTAPIDPKGGGNLEILVRNNFPGIQTYRLEPGGDGLEFFPPKAEITVGGMDERNVSFRVFAAENLSGLRDWKLRVSLASPASLIAEMPMRVLLLPRGRTLAWTADLDGDGSSEWVLESQKVRAVFSSEDGGRWTELNWKDTNQNFLPVQGTLAGQGPVEVHASGDVLEFSGKGWKRTVRLADNALTIEQTSPLPPDKLQPEKRGNVSLIVERASDRRVSYMLR